MDWRLRKQIIYGLIIFLIFFSIFLFIFLKFRKPAIATCFDGKKNQGEEGIDCGGPCPPCEIKYAEPLKIYEAEYVDYPAILNTIDIIGLLENPNKNLSLKRLNYYFEIYDFKSQRVKEKTPLRNVSLGAEEKKYLLEINYPRPRFPIGKIKLVVIDPKPEDWIKKEKEELPISYFNERLLREGNKLKMKLSLVNSSFKTYDVEIIVFLYDKNRKLIGVGKTKTTLRGQEKSQDAYVFFPALLAEPSAFEIHIQQ
jgi:hypothetical protein